MADLAASNEVNTELVAVSTDSIPVHRWQSQLGMALRIYLPTYVRYSAIYAPHISDRHPIRIRMAIPSHNVILGLTNLASSGFGGRGGRQEVP